MKPPAGGLIVLSVHLHVEVLTTSLTILGLLAVSLEPSVKTRTLCLTACTHRLPSSPNPSCRCFSSMAPISSHGSRALAAPRSPRGCRSRSGRTRRRDRLCRRGSLIQRASNRRRQSIRRLPSWPWRESQTVAIGPHAKRPRRMGQCSEVADDGENLEDHPALASRYVRRKAPVSACKSPGKIVSGA